MSNGSHRIYITDKHYRCVNIDILIMEAWDEYNRNVMKMLKQVFQILSTVKIEQAIRSIILTSMLLCHMFMHNYMGEKVTDKSSNVCEKVWVVYFW